MEKRKKEVKVTFFITGQLNRSKSIETPRLFHETWQSHFTDQTNDKIFKDFKYSSDVKKKQLILKIENFDHVNNVYFGYIGVLRDTFLPSLFDTEELSDTNIKMGDNDEILEKSYFIYYLTDDLLVYHQNYIGPTPDDLSYMLYKASNLTNIKFEPIWKNSDLKALLENGSTLKNGSITIAVPRNFNEANLDLSNSWSAEVLGMMSRTGMSRMNVNFWGRASVKKSEANYIADTVKDGLKELLTRFGSGCQNKNSPTIKKAIAQLDTGEKESLLNQDLYTKVKVDVVQGYPVPGDIRKALIRARASCNESLKAYIVERKQPA
jgi:hypothetical protein